MPRRPTFPSLPATTLQKEQAEMTEHFPHWSLTVLRNLTGEPLLCDRCHTAAQYSSSDQQAICHDCRHTIAIPKEAVLAWIGHMPVLLSGRSRARAKILRHPHPSYPLVQGGGAEFLLAPIVAAYPHNWPQHQPAVRYDAHLETMLELGSMVGSKYHMLPNYTLCLYSGGHWTAQSMRHVLQQRVVNHLASLIKCADGIPAHEAFIGHIHDQQWQPQQ